MTITQFFKKTKTEKDPGPRNADPSEINNVLAPPAYPMRYLLVVNGKAEYTDSVCFVVMWRYSFS